MLQPNQCRPGCGVPLRQGLSRIPPRRAPEPVPQGRYTCECGRPMPERGPSGCERCAALDAPRKTDRAINAGVALLQYLALAEEPKLLVELQAVRSAATQTRARTEKSAEVFITKAFNALRRDRLVASDRGDRGEGGSGAALHWTITDEGRAWLALLMEAP